MTDKPQKIERFNPANDWRPTTTPAPVNIDEHITRITFLMEDAIRIPGTKLRIGLDPIIGLLLPEVGDAISAIVSAYLILASVRYGLPKGVIARMFFNVAVDYAMGSIPVVGDIFDFAWKSNDMNLKLLKANAKGEGRSFWSDWGWALMLLGLFAILVVGLGALVVYSVWKAFIQFF
ncbi:MAG TPA: DUF4112 domain-containing protein [Blastocatellia bacterium]|jgi:hypothetical protein